MIKIAHEAPLDIFDEVQRITDYDYALVHLLEENGRYRDTFERAVKQGREVILDNSIFAPITTTKKRFNLDTVFSLNELKKNARMGCYRISENTHHHDFLQILNFDISYQMSHNLYLSGKLEYESEKYSSSHRDFPQSLIGYFPIKFHLIYT